ncbi:MAG: AEC family transporter, partial [Spirochaetales bacterium]|nr:AEC family transporter [Candidatus Physcosoma equi]
MLKALLSSFFVMVAMIALGFFLEKKGMTNKTVNKGLTDILIDVALPFNMLASSQRLFVRETGQGIICTFIIASLYFPLALLCSKSLAKMLKVPSQKRGSFISSSVIMNTGFLGFPLAESLYGQEGVLCAIPFTLVVNFFLFGFCIRLFDEKAEFSLKKVLSPAVIASVITIIVYFTQIKFPKPITDICTSMGALMTPVSMLLIGTSLVGVNIKEIFSDLHAYETCVIRLVLYPLVI